jgi:hypothetical protein
MKALIAKVDTLGNLIVSYNQSCLIRNLEHIQMVNATGNQRFIPCIMFQFVIPFLIVFVFL